MTLEKNTANWPECKTYQLDTETKPKYEDTSSRAAWIKMAAEMPLGSSYVFPVTGGQVQHEADALCRAIREVGFYPKTEKVVEVNLWHVEIIVGIRVFKLDKE